VDIIEALKPDSITLDEPQELKSAKSSRRSAAFNRIKKIPADMKIALTATPSREELIESHDLVSWTNPKSLGFRTRFERSYKGFETGSNAQQEHLERILWKEIEPYVSTDQFTPRNYKVDRQEITVKRSPQQIEQQKQIERMAEQHIKSAASRWEGVKEGAWRKKAEAKAIQEVGNMHHVNLNAGEIAYNPKMQALKSEIQKEIKSGKKKHILVVDSKEQRQAAASTLRDMGYKTTQIVNITKGVSGKDVEDRKAKFIHAPGESFIIIDHASASGHNLNAADAMHVLGVKDYDAGTLRQAYGRADRAPRKGDLTIKTYKYSDSAFENAEYQRLEKQMNVLRATSPGLFKGLSKGNSIKLAIRI